MTIKYPYGAIEDEGPILFGLLGQTLYAVHGLGINSIMTEMRNVRNLHTNASGFRAIEYDYVSEYVGTTKSSSCLGDLNIGAHHNQHFLFHDREDAEAYLAWAKTHTLSIRDRQRPYWD